MPIPSLDRFLFGQDQKQAVYTPLIPNRYITPADRDLMLISVDRGHRLAVDYTIIWFVPGPGKVVLRAGSMIKTVFLTHTMLMGYVYGYQVVLHPGQWRQIPGHIPMVLEGEA